MEKQESYKRKTLECIDNLKEAIRTLEKIADAGIETRDMPEMEKKV